MSEQFTFEVPADAAGERLDKWLAEQLPEESRSQIKRWINDGRVILGAAKASKAGEKLAAGDLVSLFKPEERTDPEPQPEKIPLDILYEDDDVAVIDKPAGLVVHPAPGHPDGTLVNALLARFPNLRDPDQPKRPGIVHRLDKDTSGVIIVAKQPDARQFLQRQFRKREVEKTYLALVRGIPDATRGKIEAPIGRDPDHRQRLWVVPKGRPAVTEFEIRETFSQYSMLTVRPVTGRTHQIRVHLAAIDHPVVNDAQYGYRRGAPALPAQRQCLHAWKLRITVPAGERMTFEAPLPDDIAATLDFLRSQ